IAFQVPVTPNGAWQGAFTVPSNVPVGSGGLPAAVSAVCVSSGWQALSTIYAPQTFTVTAQTTATAPTGETTAPPGRTTPTTLPNAPGGGQTNPTTPTTTDHGRPSSGAPMRAPRDPVGSVPVGVRGDGAGAVTRNAAAGSSSARGAGGELADRHAAHARSATLQPADLGASLASDRGTGPGGLGWLGWFLVVVLVAGLAGTPALLWRSRGRDASEPVGEAA
ncbi:MAG TPA: hypothetical protein VK771_00945, partial [Acidimicrobiia bacterium]|nr:hypothetical protein [Acidimicrobiia bacterium]